MYYSTCVLSSCRNQEVHCRSHYQNIIIFRVIGTRENVSEQVEHDSSSGESDATLLHILTVRVYVSQNLTLVKSSLKGMLEYPEVHVVLELEIPYYEILK